MNLEEAQSVLFSTIDLVRKKKHHKDPCFVISLLVIKKLKFRFVNSSDDMFEVNIVNTHIVQIIKHH